MKKSLFFLATAAVVLAGCNKDVKIAENVVPAGANAQKEIAFSPLSQKAHYLPGIKKAAIDGTTFPTTADMQVAAYDVTNTRNFFTHTTFSYSGASNIWKGGKYWPLSAAYINFLAYANFNGTAGSETDGATWATDEASEVTLVMTDNKTAQKDLMYAIGNGQVTQSGNNLTFPTNVPMQFKHAQAWISFNADAYDATSGGKVTLQSITLNGAKYNGTYTVTQTNYDATSSQSVAGAWSALGSTADVVVPNWTPAAIAFDDSGNGVAVGDGLMIVPDDNNATADFTSFTVAYTLDGNNYTYTYTPATAAAANVDQAKHYIYNIVFHLHEIEIAATVLDWADQTPVDVPIF